MAYDFVQIDNGDLEKKLSSLTLNEKRYLIEVLELYLSEGALTLGPGDICDE